MSLLAIIIPSGVSLIGFSITLIALRLEFNNSKKQKIVDDQRDLYINLYDQLDKVLSDIELIYNKDYFNNVYSYKSKVKLIV